MKRSRYVGDRSKISTILLVLFVGVLLGTASWYFIATNNSKNSNFTKTPESFADCVASGSPVLQSYPERCDVNGQSYTNPNQVAPGPKVAP